MDFVWLAASTVRLQVSDYSQLSDYNCTEWLAKHKAADATITFGEVVMAIISIVIHHMEHFLTGFIREWAGQLNAAAKSLEFDISPTTL